MNTGVARSTVWRGSPGRTLNSIGLAPTITEALGKVNCSWIAIEIPGDRLPHVGGMCRFSGHRVIGTASPARCAAVSLQEDLVPAEEPPPRASCPYGNGGSGVGCGAGRRGSFRTAPSPPVRGRRRGCRWTERGWKLTGCKPSASSRVDKCRHLFTIEPVLSSYKVPPLGG